MAVVLAVTWDVVRVRVGGDISTTSVLLIPVVDRWLTDWDAMGVEGRVDWEVVGNVLAATTLIDLSETSLVELVSDVPFSSNCLRWKGASVHELTHAVVAGLRSAEVIRTATMDDIGLEIWRDADGDLAGLVVNAGTLDGNGAWVDSLRNVAVMWDTGADTHALEDLGNLEWLAVDAREHLWDNVLVREGVTHWTWSTSAGWQDRVGDRAGNASLGNGPADGSRRCVVGR